MLATGLDQVNAPDTLRMFWFVKVLQSCDSGHTGRSELAFGRTALEGSRALAFRGQGPRRWPRVPGWRRIRQAMPVWWCDDAVRGIRPRGRCNRGSCCGGARCPFYAGQERAGDDWDSPEPDSDYGDADDPANPPVAGATAGGREPGGRPAGRRPTTMRVGVATAGVAARPDRGTAIPITAQSLASAPNTSVPTAGQAGRGAEHGYSDGYQRRPVQAAATGGELPQSAGSRGGAWHGNERRARR